MFAFVTVVLFLAAAIGSYLGANSCEAGSGAQQGLLVLAGALATAVVPSVQSLLAKIRGRDDQPGPRAAAALLLLGALLLAGQARADNQFGGCISDDTICFGPAVTVTVGEFNFSTNKFSGGIVPGVGYGVTYAQSEWYATGLAGYLSFTLTPGEPNEAVPSVMMSFANYIRLGVGVSITETDGPVETQWRLLFGVGSDFGGTPEYVSSQGTR